MQNKTKWCPCRQMEMLDHIPKETESKLEEMGFTFADDKGSKYIYLPDGWRSVLSSPPSIGYYDSHNDSGPCIHYDKTGTVFMGGWDIYDTEDNIRINIHIDLSRIIDKITSFRYEFDIIER